MRFYLKQINRKRAAYCITAVRASYKAKKALSKSRKEQVTRMTRKIMNKNSALRAILLSLFIGILLFSALSSIKVADAAYPTITVGNNPYGVGYAFNGDIYVTNLGANSVCDSYVKQHGHHDNQQSAMNHMELPTHLTATYT